MSDVIPRRAVHDGELERYWQIVDAAIEARVTRADFLPPQVIEERDVLVYCVNRGGAPGKRYRYEPGWTEVFMADLQDGYFLAA